jgi:hypothetical protein
MTKNDLAWEKFFRTKNIQKEISKKGYAYVLADEMKEYGGREPRLMAKLDSLNERPNVFKESGLTIFPVENGKYIIFNDHNNKSYFSFDQTAANLVPTKYNSRINLNSFDTYPKNQTLSESQAIDFAYISSLFKTFTGDENLRLTIRGRLFSREFYFDVPNLSHKAIVKGVQIELDAGYESDDKIYLIEAKIGLRGDFHIRQLYFPYLEWAQRSNKKIVPIFFVYSNGKYYFIEMEFNQEFGNIRIIRQLCYTINEEPITELSLLHFLKTIPEKSEPNVPFPQANNLDKIVDLIKFVQSGAKNKYAIAEYFEFNERQGDYYANAASYLRLLEKTKDGFILTAKGDELSKQEFLVERTKLLIIQMLEVPSLRDVLILFKKRNYNLKDISDEEIAQIIRKHINVNEITAMRRSSTVKSWLNWIIKNCKIRDK